MDGGSFAWLRHHRLTRAESREASEDALLRREALTGPLLTLLRKLDVVLTGARRWKNPP
jgi:hypothetical protein